MNAKIAQPALFVASEIAAPLAEIARTLAPWTGAPSRSLTLTASVPWLGPKAATGGATRLDSVTGAMSIPATFEVTVLVMRRYWPCFSSWVQLAAALVGSRVPSGRGGAWYVPPPGGRAFSSWEFQGGG